MNLRALFLTVGILLAGIVLFLVGGLGVVELATSDQCGATGYLCVPPVQTADTQRGLDYDGLLRAERRVGLLH
jgi:hypothetical protein